MADNKTKISTHAHVYTLSVRVRVLYIILEKNKRKADELCCFRSVVSMCCVHTALKSNSFEKIFISNQVNCFVYAINK